MGIDPVGNIFSHSQVQQLITLAIEEDIGGGDITTKTLVPKGKYIYAQFIAKEQGVLCGSPLIKKIIKSHDSEAKIDNFLQEGDYLKPGECFCQVYAQAHTILTYERIILNFIQRLSGIATKTKSYTEKISDKNLQVLDTRKTTPGWRILEKYAVRVGGGTNHRMGLFDQYMIKDNHYYFLKQENKSIANIISECRKKNPNVLIEWEVETIEQVKEIVQTDIDIIMLDNMDIETRKEALHILENSNVKVEVSGNITKEKIIQENFIGIDYISIGELTYSVPAIDISLRFEKTC